MMCYVAMIKLHLPKSIGRQRQQEKNEGSIHDPSYVRGQYGPPIQVFNWVARWARNWLGSHPPRNVRKNCLGALQVVWNWDNEEGEKCVLGTALSKTQSRRFYTLHCMTVCICFHT